jgi:O-methyltransferase involved in polyketide biosynthesis
MELSSGYSFRSLDYTRQKGVHYIDTDLPEVIAVKKEFLAKLVKEDSFGDGKLELLPLNAQDENAFRKIVGHFPQGEITIVNEGLMGYLNQQEKEQLCSIIHGILKERGGYWITADIHLKNFESKPGLQYSDEVRKFNEQQQTNENNFDSFREAELFFNRMGFVIDKVAKLKYSELNSFKFMIRSLKLRQLFKVRKGHEIQATWRLRAV